MAERARSPKNKAAKGNVKGKAIAELPKGKKRGIGDNSGEVPDEVILRHLSTLKAKLAAMEKVQEELDQARGVYRSARKVAKKEGVNLDGFDIMRKLEQQDHGSVLVNHADAGRYLRLTESPLALQMDLFQNLQKPAPVVDVALQGQAAGKNGEPMDVNPHPPGSPEFAIWHENWTLGQQQIADSMGSGSGATH